MYSLASFLIFIAAKLVVNAITVNTPFNIDLEFRAATFYRRIFAWFIDLAVLTVYNYVIIYLVGALGFSEGIDYALYTLLAAVPSYLYHLIMEQFLNGQSLGKRAMAIKVISRLGDQPTLGQYVLRWILSIGNVVLFIMPYLLISFPYIVPFLFIFYLPDVISIAVSSSSQRLGDLAAGTVLIDSRRDLQIQDTIYLEIEEEQYTALYPEVMRLTDRDINGIRNLLNVKKHTRDNELYMMRIAERIKEVLKIQSPLVPEDFLRQLLKDYNYLTRK